LVQGKPLRGKKKKSAPLPNPRGVPRNGGRKKNAVNNPPAVGGAGGDVAGCLGCRQKTEGGGGDNEHYCIEVALSIKVEGGDERGRPFR